MRKTFLWAAGLMMALTACQKEEAPFAPEGASTQTITVSIPQGVQTRSAGTYNGAADYGKAAEINRCILQVYREGVAYGDQIVVGVENGEGDKKTAKFDLRLVAQQKYDFVFWADCATPGTDGTFTDNHYNTGDLTNITVKDSYAGNNDEFDAFFLCKENFNVTNSFTVNDWVLKRPFGQLNVKTLDMNAIPENAALKPNKVKVVFSALPTSFNAKAGTVGTETDEVEYTADIISQTNGELTVDYIWVPEGEQNELVNFSMEFYNVETLICKNEDFKNIPVRRNYRTNVSGNLLTKKGDITVTIDPTFDGTLPDQVIAEVATAADVAQAIINGATDIIVKEAPTNDATVNIPYVDVDAANNALSITLPETEHSITVGYTTRTGNAAPLKVNVTIPTAENLEINLPESTVTLNGKKYNNVGSSTSGNTLIVPEDVTVENLTVKKGNVEIYGTVNNIKFEGNEAGVVTTYAVGNAETLAKAAALVGEGKCAKIMLTADIDLQGSTDNLWTPINAENNVFVEFDGTGHTISNLYVDNYTGNTDSKGTYYGGLFYVLRGMVKDLTIDGANVTCFRGGTLAGRMDYGTVENCHVKKTTVNSIQKVAGLVGYVNNSTKDVTIRNCSVEQCQLNTLRLDYGGIFQAGGLIGYLQTSDRNVLIEGNSVSGIAFNKVYAPADDVVDKVHDMEQCYSHAFIGTIANFSDSPVAYLTYKIELKNNTVAEQVSGIPTCDRTDDYIGWWGGEYNIRDYTPKIIVDGQEKDRWIEVKRIYNLLNAGGDITIHRNCNLTRYSETKGKINITVPTTLTLEKGTLTVGKQQIVNQSELTIDGKGTMTATAWVIMNEGKLVINGGNFKSTATGDAYIVYNTSAVEINGGTLEANGSYAIGNNYGESVTINGGSITSKGSQDYCILMHGSGVLTVTNGTITGNFGGVRLHGGTTANISGGEFICTGQYYALFVGASGSGATANISGGKFRSTSTSAPNKCVYVAKNNVLNLTGGKFQNKGYDANTSSEITPQTGYSFIENNNDETYPFEVVAQQ